MPTDLQPQILYLLKNRPRTCDQLRLALDSNFMAVLVTLYDLSRDGRITQRMPPSKYEFEYRLVEP